ncbi:MAG: preprotein translocase subunit YajC [Acidobacteriota bacterium]|nr:preprotein translocase subunit YajC [Acidobacteriota bacterium]
MLLLNPMFPALLLQAGLLGPLTQALPIIVIFGIFYFLLFLPMQKQKKNQKLMLENLKAGDAVVTTGGIVGNITSIDGDTLILRVKPDNLKLQFSRSAVASLVNNVEVLPKA